MRWRFLFQNIYGFLKNDQILTDLWRKYARSYYVFRKMMGLDLPVNLTLRRIFASKPQLSYIGWKSRTSWAFFVTELGILNVTIKSFRRNKIENYRKLPKMYDLSWPELFMVASKIPSSVTKKYQLVELSHPLSNSWGFAAKNYIRAELAGKSTTVLLRFFEIF